MQRAVCAAASRGAAAATSRHGGAWSCQRQNRRIRLGLTRTLLPIMGACAAQALLSSAASRPEPGASVLSRPGGACCRTSEEAFSRLQDPEPLAALECLLACDVLRVAHEDGALGLCLRARLFGREAMQDLACKGAE